jgi:hypothetical protein
MIETLLPTFDKAGTPELLSSGIVADSPIVYRFGNGSVLKISPPAFPNVAREMAEKVSLAHEVLGEELGWAAPVLLGQSEIDGCTCAWFGELAPISNNRMVRIIQLRRIAPAVLSWLRGVARLDRGINDQAGVCLRALAGCPYGVVSRPAQEALIGIERGAFLAQSRIMHGDLWLGNVMRDPAGVCDFVIIDWRGANLDGFPVFDLVKFAQSAEIGRRALRAELTAHAAALGCGILDTRTYLLAALGHIWINLDQFPPDRFAAMAESCLDTLERALNA